MLDLTEALPWDQGSHVCVYVVFMSELDKKLVSKCPVPLLTSLVPRHFQYRYLDWSQFRDDGFTVLVDSEYIQPFMECLKWLPFSPPPHIK